MKKLAIFVEGQTEQIFVKKLVSEIANSLDVVVRCVKASGGGSSSSKRSITVLEGEATSSSGAESFYVLIQDCGTDNRVASDIRDSYATIAAEGHLGIIGIRDLHPLALLELSKLQDGMRRQLENSPILVQLVIAVMEVEAWFLAETNHFAEIDPKLDSELVVATLGFDLAVGSLENRPRPSSDLDNAYRAVGKAYTKRRSDVERTVRALDYESLYLTVVQRVPSLAGLINRLNHFFGGGGWRDDVAA